MTMKDLVNICTVSSSRDPCLGRSHFGYCSALGFVCLSLCFVVVLLSRGIRFLIVVGCGCGIDVFFVHCRGSVVRQISVAGCHGVQTKSGSLYIVVGAQSWP